MPSFNGRYKARTSGEVKTLNLAKVPNNAILLRLSDGAWTIVS